MFGGSSRGARYKMAAAGRKQSPFTILKEKSRLKKI
jgi:hypothetical protein